MADKVVQLKNKDGDNLYPVSVLPGERILWEDTLEVAPEHSEGVNDMIGATATSAGAHGLVPAPAAGDQDKVLKGDGTWASATFDDMTGATASAAGVHGLVPKPAAGDQNKFLKGDGTWGASVSYETTTGSNVNPDDRYAPITTGVSVQDGSALTDAQCVFNFTNIGGANQYETKIFANAKIANPIGGATIYGVMETKEYISDGNLYIEQIFKRKQYGSIGDQQVFRRLGYIQGWTGDKYTGVTSATITWKTWYILEYPVIDIKSYLTNNFSGTYLNLSVAGGIAHIRGQGLSSTNASGINPVLTTAIPGILAKDDANGVSCRAVANDVPTLVKWGKGVNTLTLFGYTSGTNLYFSVLIPLGY